MERNQSHIALLYENEILRLKRLNQALEQKIGGFHNHFALIEHNNHKIETLRKLVNTRKEETVEPFPHYPGFHIEGKWEHSLTQSIKRAKEYDSQLRSCKAYEKPSIWADIQIACPGFRHGLIICLNQDEDAYFIIGQVGQEHPDLLRSAETTFGDTFSNVVSTFTVVNQSDQVIQIDAYDRIAPWWTTKTTSSAARLSLPTGISGTNEVRDQGIQEFALLGPSSRVLLKDIDQTLSVAL